MNQVSPSTVPAHVAIIMDGNGRWANARGLPRAMGHRKGVEAVREAVKTAGEFGVSYLTLFEAYYRGRVSVVSPLVATETLWGVGLAALFLRSALVGRRLALGAALIVAGAALIGIFR